MRDPKVVDLLGNVVPRADPLVTKGPPALTPAGYKLVNSIGTQRVLIDDHTKVVYKREDVGTEFFYLRDNPPEDSLDVEKVLYVYVKTGLSNGDIITIFLDKFGLEWVFLIASEVDGLTYMGNPISRYGGLGTLHFGFQNLSRILRPAYSMSSPPLSRSMPRLAVSGTRVSFADGSPRPSVPLGFRPIAPIYSHTVGGYPAGRGLSRPPMTPRPTTKPLYHVPMGSTRFTPGRSPWATSCKKPDRQNFRSGLSGSAGQGIHMTTYLHSNRLREQRK